MSTGSMGRRSRDAASLVRVAVALACLLLVAAACSGQGNPHAASGRDAASSGKAGDVCTLVTKADVAAAYGGDVSAGTPADGTTCHFKIAGTAKAGKSLSGDVPEVIVSLRPGMYNSTADQQKLFPGNQVKPVAGLGEEAWSSGLDLNVKHGADSLSVVNVGFTGYDSAELTADAIALARIVYPRL